MPIDLRTALSAVADRLLLLAREDPQLRVELQRCALAVLNATCGFEETAAAPHSAPASDTISPVSGHDDGTGETAAGVGKDSVATAVSPAASDASAPGETTVAAERTVQDAGPRDSAPATAAARVEPTPHPELTLGRSIAPADSGNQALVARWGDSADDEDLPLIIERCRLKAEAARWAVERQRLIAEGANYAIDIEPPGRELIARAKALPDCFLWMCHPSGPCPSDLKLYEDVAGCFDAVAACLSDLRQVEEAAGHGRKDFMGLLHLLAEAQSALRLAIDRIGGKPDLDQIRTFDWLKTTVNEHQIYIPRHMRADDPADSTQWKGLVARISAAGDRIQSQHQQEKHRRKLFGKIRHKLSLLQDDPEAAEAHWRQIAEVVEQLLADGLPPSNRELRDLLAPALTSLPPTSDLPKGFQRVIEEVEDFSSESPSSDESTPVATSAEIEQVAALLEGRAVVLIGGDCRPHAREALKNAFRLSDLFWIETRDHESLEGFRPTVSRPDVAVVLLLIRLTSHSHGEIKDQCERTGKPLVRLPRGYNANQVASEILQQCSKQLATKKLVESTTR